MDDSEAAFWRQAAREGLPWFRWLRWPLTVAELDRQLRGGGLQSEWEALKGRLEPGDELWPFEFHVRSYLGMRSGVIALRLGLPIGGVVILVS